MTTDTVLTIAFVDHRDTLLRYLRARGAADEADDLLQDLWLKLERLAPAPVDDARAYLMRMAHNLMLDRVRATARRRLRDDAYHEQGPAAGRLPGTVETLLARERLRHVEQALGALGERTDWIFRRHRIDGVAQSDIAREIGVSLSAVEKHLQKAYRAIATLDRADDGSTQSGSKAVTGEHGGS